MVRFVSPPELVTLASDPAGGQGDLYYNSATKTVRYHDGTTWNDLGGGGATGPCPPTAEWPDTVDLSDKIALKQLKSFDTLDVSDAISLKSAKSFDTVAISESFQQADVSGALPQPLHMREDPSVHPKTFDTFGVADAIALKQAKSFDSLSVRETLGGAAGVRVGALAEKAAGLNDRSRFYISAVTDDDAYVDHENPTSNYGGATSLHIHYDTVVVNDGKNGWIKFDFRNGAGQRFANLAPHALDVVLNFRATTSNLVTATSLRVDDGYASTDPFVEGSITWNNQPAVPGQGFQQLNIQPGASPQWYAATLGTTLDVVLGNWLLVKFSIGIVASSSDTVTITSSDMLASLAPYLSFQAKRGV